MTLNKKKFSLSIVLVLVLVMMFQTAVFAYATKEMEINGVKMLMNSDYPSSDIPEGFTEVALEYEGETFYGGEDDATHSIHLYYFSCESDSSKDGFYQLKSDGTFVKYDATGLGGKSFVFAEPAKENVPFGYDATQMNAKGTVMDAYQDSKLASNYPSIYLVYGSLSGGENGWYLYDTEGDAIMPYVYGSTSSSSEDKDDTTSPEEEEATTIADLQTQLKELNNKYNKDIGRSKNLFIFALVITVLCIFIAINSSIKRKHERMDLEDRILDLKRHGGVETISYSKRELRRNAKLDAKAEDRLNKLEDRYVDDDDMYDLREPDEFDDRKRRKSDKKMTRAEKKAAKKAAKLGMDFEDDLYDDIEPAPAPKKKKSKAAENEDLKPRRKAAESSARNTRSLEDTRPRIEAARNKPSRERKPVYDDDMLDIGGIEEGLEAALRSEGNAKNPVRGITEDMSVALGLSDDDFDMDIIDLD